MHYYIVSWTYPNGETFVYLARMSTKQAGKVNDALRRQTSLKSTMIRMAKPVRTFEQITQIMEEEFA